MYKKTECNSKFALKGESGNTINAYTKRECDSKFSSKQQQYSLVDLVQYDYNYVQYIGWMIDCCEDDDIIFERYLNNTKFHFETFVCDGQMTFVCKSFTFEAYIT